MYLISQRSYSSHATISSGYAQVTIQRENFPQRLKLITAVLFSKQCSFLESGSCSEEDSKNNKRNFWLEVDYSLKNCIETQSSGTKMERCLTVSASGEAHCMSSYCIKVQMGKEYPSLSPEW